MARRVPRLKMFPATESAYFLSDRSPSLEYTRGLGGLFKIAALIGLLFFRNGMDGRLLVPVFQV
jgi:hypothetical protein